MSLWVKGQLINDPKQIATLYPVALGKHRFSTLNNYRSMARDQKSTERTLVPSRSVMETVYIITHNIETRKLTLTPQPIALTEIRRFVNIIPLVFRSLKIARS